MTNEEKAKEIELDVYIFDEKLNENFEAPAYRAAIKMAKWKDEQYIIIIDNLKKELKETFIKKATEWLLSHISLETECNENGEPLAESFIENRKIVLKITEDFHKDIEKEI